MDSNSKLGRHFIPLDPHEQSANGKVLAGIIERNNLVVANGLNAKCVGAITRRRVTSKSTEESIIDHVIISFDIEEYLEYLCKLVVGCRKVLYERSLSAAAVIPCDPRHDGHTQSPVTE